MNTPRPLLASAFRSLQVFCPRQAHQYAPPVARAFHPSRSSSKAVHPLRHRAYHASAINVQSSAAPKNRDRGPVSQEDTQTDFGQLDVLNNTVAPSTSIDACLSDGFQLNSGLRITGGSGVLLIAGEAFAWRPFEGRRAPLINAKGQWECDDEAWGVLDLVWPKPDLLILGLGPNTHPISPQTRRYISSLGIRVDIQDTRNAAAEYNLLATERGIGDVAAAFLPIGWKDRT